MIYILIGILIYFINYLTDDHVLLHIYLATLDVPNIVVDEQTGDKCVKDGHEDIVPNLGYGDGVLLG
jgi:hypothetical protein